LKQKQHQLHTLEVKAATIENLAAQFQRVLQNKEDEVHLHKLRVREQEARGEALCTAVADLNYEVRLMKEAQSQVARTLCASYISRSDSPR